MEIDATRHSPEERAFIESWMKEERRRERERQKNAQCPIEAPRISVTGTIGGEHRIYFHESKWRERRGVPLGATALELWRYLSPHHHADISQMEGELIGRFKRCPIRVPVLREHDGLRVRYLARWVGREPETYSDGMVTQSMTVVAMPRQVSIEIGARETSVTSTSVT